MNDKKTWWRWLLFSAVGLALTGTGLSMAIDAGLAKLQAASFHDWFWYGTFSLIVFNLGLVLFGIGIKFYVRLDQAH